MGWRVLAPATLRPEPGSSKPISKPRRVAPVTTARTRDTHSLTHTHSEADRRSALHHAPQVRQTKRHQVQRESTPPPRPEIGSFPPKTLPLAFSQRSSLSTVCPCPCPSPCL